MGNSYPDIITSTSTADITYISTDNTTISSSGYYQPTRIKKESKQEKRDRVSKAKMHGSWLVYNQISPKIKQVVRPAQHMHKGRR